MNPELLNLHKRLSVQSLVIANNRPMFTKCQHLFALGGSNLQESGDFTWRLSDCEELVGGYSQEMMGEGDY